MELTEDMTLRDLLEHIQDNIRKMTKLRAEYSRHTEGKSDLKTSTQLLLKWEHLRRDVPRVLGQHAELKRYSELAAPGSFHTYPITGRDPFLIKLGVLKQRADKARRRQPDIALLQNWEPHGDREEKDDARE